MERCVSPRQEFAHPGVDEQFSRDREPEHSAERNLATNLLIDYAADQPQVLAELLMDADKKQFAVIFRMFVGQAERGVPILINEIDRKLPPDANGDAREELAKWQANAAVALLKMNQPAKVWPLLRHSPDPRARSYLIHRLGPLRADPRAIIQSGFWTTRSTCRSGGR